MTKSFKEIKQTLLMLQSIDRRVAQNFEKRTGISFTRYEMLHTLFERAQLSQIELQQTLKIDQAAITRHLKILEEKNFVVRNRNKQNNREVIVEITDAGISTLENCDLDKNQFIDELFNGFTDQEIKQLQILVKKLIDNTEMLNS
ncbi:MULTISPECIES: MarR family winged helix-turn-helix transcriptional regulator [Psychrobacillus]|uniref:MarR family transcriptional regulator n=1 Tax=Psychrobacillus faecigallinarum TaxID=2762235 RepID=A0ABR8RD16_9BACI|nr:MULTISPECIES: MarR family transcriptional regulator [Psychrobacillus]MBD7945651.1 MarR family transcriptional regulator [Psychrobacillus faecigallinarum]QEY22397.1 MarR family transcriptional regulator [Psychrobacillus sp. AK 1817]QGM29283.1 MarR family transcriptional regulator [Bacillus sp. N3536]